MFPPQDGVVVIVRPVEVESLAPDESNSLAINENSSHWGDPPGLLPRATVG